MDIESDAKLDYTASDLAAIRSQNYELEKQNQEIENQIAVLMNDLIEGKCLEALITNRQMKIDNAANQIADTEKQIATLREEIMVLEEAKSIHKPILNPLNNIIIDKLIKNKTITTKDVENVMRSIDRGDFAPNRPYMDKPQQIGFGTTISAPHMHAHQLGLLRNFLRNAGRAIDIGCGSGYFTLAMAKLMPTGAKVYGIDHIQKICELAKNNISKSHADYILTNKIEIACDDGRKGWQKGAPYDVIYVGGAIPKIPEEMITQLAPGGTLVAPVGDITQKLTCLQKGLDGQITVSVFMDCMFGKLQDKNVQWPENGEDDNKDSDESSDGIIEEENSDGNGAENGDMDEEGEEEDSNSLMTSEENNNNQNSSDK